MLCHTFEMSIFVPKSYFDKSCMQDTTFSHKLYDFCPGDSFGEYLINMTTEHWDGALLIGINCWCSCSDSFSDAEAFENLQTSQQLILKDLITLDLAHLLLSGTLLPRPICFESHASSRSLPSLLNTTSNWEDLSSKSCVYWAATCWSRMTSWNFSDSDSTIWR